MRDLLRDLENYLSSKSDDHEDPVAEGLLMRLSEAGPRILAAGNAAYILVEAYAAASEDNGGDSSVDWETVDMAHELALNSVTDEELRKIANQAREYNQ